MTSSFSSLLLPSVASPLTSGQDSVFYFVFWLGVFFFVLVLGFLIYFAVKYKKKSDKDVTYEWVGNTKLEVFWSVVPSILLAVVFVWGLLGWMSLNTPPQDSIEVHVTARKWDWLFTDVKTGSESSDLIVPIGKPVKLIMSSADVIHGFYVPGFRINRDVLPSQYTVVWFKAEKAGDYPVYCSQYCGTKHSQMIRYVRVMEPAAYEKALVAAQGAGLSSADLGKKIFGGKGACASCHDVSSDKKRLVGPALYGIFGEKLDIVLSDGTKKTVTIDENYLKRSILEPNFRSIPGYPNVMPSYQGQLSDKEVVALTEYMKSLGAKK